MRLHKVTWSWDYGKVESEITYIDGTTEHRTNEERPPTNPAHDIAHFICGFHDDLDWDYSIDPNLIAEYNAVFMESLLFYHTSIRAHERYMSLNEISIKVKDHMRWFAREYYKIPEGCSKLRKNFLSKLDPSIVAQHYETFYDVYVMEGKQSDPKDIKVSHTMDSDLDRTDKAVYDYIVKMQTFLGV